MTKREMDEAMVAVVLPVLDPKGAAQDALAEYNKAWAEFALAHQELTDSIRMFLKEQVRVEYWVCLQDPEHFWDYDDPRIAMVPSSWRTQGKSRCPSCAGILERRIAKVSKR